MIDTYNWLEIESFSLNPLIMNPKTGTRTPSTCGCSSGNDANGLIVNADACSAAISSCDPGAYEEELSSSSYATDVRRLSFCPNAILPASLEFQVF